VLQLTVPGEYKQKGETIEAEIKAVKAPDGKLNVIGLVTDPESDGTPWVAHHISNESAHNDTEDGYYSVVQQGNST